MPEFCSVPPGANLTRLQGLEFHRDAGAAAPKDLRVSIPLQNAMTRKRLAEAIAVMSSLGAF
jgi:hypothetical protein